jgi:uracil-DNA glycosylase family 4
MGNIQDLNDEVINCRKCPRLVDWRESVSKIKRRAFLNWDYWGKPVPGFGDINGRVLVVGLAPGAHGSNRTGRMFTGDASGDFLFPALYVQGFANQGESLSKSDDLALIDLYITAICRCVPPNNKPTTAEIKTCVPYLQREIEMMGNLQVVVSLGAMAHSTVLQLFFSKSEMKSIPFIHGGIGDLGKGIKLVSSYHPSRQNTQTGKLTNIMFNNVWLIVRNLLHS